MGYRRSKEIGYIIKEALIKFKLHLLYKNMEVSMNKRNGDSFKQKLTITA